MVLRSAGNDFFPLWLHSRKNNKSISLVLKRIQPFTINNPHPMKTVLIGGGTGLIGQRLSQLLQKEGYRVLHLSRRPDPEAAFPAFAWDPFKGEIDQAVVEQADFIINLAGAGIADAPWTRERKRLIIESRTRSLALLRDAVAARKTPPEAFLSASAIGYYGDRGEELLKETDPPGESGFLPESVTRWEGAILTIDDLGIRTVGFRIGIVLSTQGGALEKMMLPARFRIGGYFGDGRQWYSWIHIDDLCRMFLFALEQPDLGGFFNAAAPTPVRNKELVRELSAAMGKPAFLVPGPEPVLRLALGEMAETILSSTRVSAEKILETGFSFRFPTLRPALEDLIERKV